MLIIIRGGLFMKIKARLTAAAVAAALCVSAAAPVYAAADSAVVYDDQGNVSFSMEVNENAPRFDDIDAAAEYVKAQLKQRVSEFDLLVTGWAPENDNDDVTDHISEKLITITDDPTEGLYLSLTANITCGCLYPSEGAYAKYAVKYYTTPEEEDEVTAAVAKLLLL